MKKSICMTLAVLALGSVAWAQTTNPNYEVTTFGSPHVNTPGGERSDTRSVAADSSGSIFVLKRSTPQVLIFDREGELQNSWGDGLFDDSHNIYVDHLGFLWIGDRSNHVIYKYTRDGERLMTLGTKGVSGDDSATSTFNRAAHVTVAPNGDIFVADGYVNHRIVHFSKDGTFINIIGGLAGSGTGQLDVVHGVQVDSRGRLVVLDGHLENPRIQIFSQEGQLLDEWTDLGLQRGSGLAVDANNTVYIGDSDGEQIIAVRNGEVVERIEGIEARPHNITLDRETGDLYLADTGALGGRVKKIVKK
jgi:streptogramin lyase